MMSLLPLYAFLYFMLLFTGMPQAAAPPPQNEALITATAWTKEKKENEEFIPWTVERLLTWNDFKSPPRQGTDAVASTSTTLGLNYILKNGRLEYEITCNFSKKRSWGLVKTDYILAHEQAHFDITELFARKLHQQLQAYTPNRKTFQKDINTIYENVVKAKEAFQRLYDAETDHSRKRVHQEEWLVRIDDMLFETEGLASYP